MKKYRALFLAGDATLVSKDFYAPEDFGATAILLELMDARQDLQEKYSCPISVRVYFVEEVHPVS